MTAGIKEGKFLGADLRAGYFGLYLHEGKWREIFSSSIWAVLLAAVEIKLSLRAMGLCSADLSFDELKTHITLHGELRREREFFWWGPNTHTQNHNPYASKTDEHFLLAIAMATLSNQLKGLNYSSRFPLQSILHTHTHSHLPPPQPATLLLSLSRWFTRKLYHLARWCRLWSVIACFIWSDRTAISHVMDRRPIIQG